MLAMSTYEDHDLVDLSHAGTDGDGLTYPRRFKVLKRTPWTRTVLLLLGQEAFEFEVEGTHWTWSPGVYPFFSKVTHYYFTLSYNGRDVAKATADGGKAVLTTEVVRRGAPVQVEIRVTGAHEIILKIAVSVDGAEVDRA
jgi:hypothetical protein